MLKTLFVRLHLKMTNIKSYFIMQLNLGQVRAHHTDSAYQCFTYLTLRVIGQMYLAKALLSCSLFQLPY